MPLLAIAVSYVLSSISFPYWIGRRYGVDLRAAGSRKLGGSNLAKLVGAKQGIVAGTLDGAKGFVAVIVARAIGLPLEVQLACGIAAIAGQMWPVFHRFDGGRANATGWGFAIAADPIAAAIMLVPVVSATVLRRLVPSRPSRIVPLACLLSFAVFPAVIWETDGATPTVVAGLVVLGLVVVRRLTAGIRDDLATGAPAARVLANRAIFDRTELQERGLVAI